MQKIAFIFLLVFMSSQTLSTYLSFTDEGREYVLSADKEKDAEKSKEDVKKEKEKYFHTYSNKSKSSPGELNPVALSAEKYSSPTAESVTPPPDLG